MLKSLNAKYIPGRKVGGWVKIKPIMETLDLVKDDSKLKKKMKSINEQNVDMIATASKLRKQYEQLYRQVRKIVYPKSASRLGDD